MGQERASLEASTTALDDLALKTAEASELLVMAREEGDGESLDLISIETDQVFLQLEKLEFLRMFAGELDGANAFVDIQAGSGGTEAQDWADMLLRMYLRWAEDEGLATELVERSDGEVAGIKSATIQVKGEYAFGKLRTETGVHRLVRKSPFDSGNRRHTSFASVFVYPEVDESVEIEINPADLKIDTYRASGAGGQHVNKTDSAVRLTHLPTGVVVECQDERSQHKNKARAMSILQSRLLEAKISAQKIEEAQNRRNLVGSGDRSERIRTYNFPQGRVTDHRINLTLYKLDEVLTGDLEQVIAPLVAEHQADELAALGSD